ncbi:MAG: DUF423 domain-containing protein [Methylococcaceae bacterium]|nr:DUF423 domain-containing protein [Methylococcaceae bacterium]
MKSIFLFLGAISAFTGVAMGAFGAHGLKAILTPEMMAVYQTGVSYQMWHALGLIGVAIIRHLNPASKLLSMAGWLMFLGIALFSGSLYLLALLSLSWLGMVTPFGGACFLVAWLLIASYAARKPQSKRYA